MTYALRPRRAAPSSPFGSTAALTLALALGFSAAAAGSAAAQTQARSLESSKNWSVMAPKDAPVRTCFAATAPIDSKSSRSGIKRGDPFLIVAAFPEYDVRGQVVVTLGYPADTKKPITLKVDQKTFTLFAEGGEAWLDSPDDDATVVAAMRAGAKAWVKATSTRGTTITDEYSLVGFTKAEKRAREICN